MKKLIFTDDVLMWGKETKKKLNQWYPIIKQGFSNYGRHTTSGTPATVQWYMVTVTKIKG
jgi:hypothetical protein